MSKTTIQGKYLSNVFLIEFPEHVKIFNKSGVGQGPINQQDYATFIHEYWHFLMNISTVVRFRDFSTWHQMIPIFTKTLTENADGTADGNAITDNDSIQLDELTELIFAYNGDGFEELIGKTVNDFRVTGNPINEDCEMILKGKKIKFIKVKIPVEVSTEKGTEQVNYVLGNNTIDESIANSVERIIFDDKIKPPAIPYLMLEKMSEYYGEGLALNNYELAAIGTLSFLTTNPALSLHRLFLDHIKNKKRKSITQSLSDICDIIKPDFINVANILLADLQSIQNVYKGREPADYAINYISDRIKKAIDLRLSNLLFDLEPFQNGTLQQEKLNKLVFEIIPPCDIKQELEGEEDVINKDVLKSFDRGVINLNGNIINSGYLMQVLHCQMDFFRAHWSFNLIQNSEKATSVCPYYTTCNLEFRQKDKQVCKTKPWETFSTEHENCMYGTGVAALMGVVKIRKKNNA